jgi:acyl carrier protein
MVRSGRAGCTLVGTTFPCTAGASRRCFAPWHFVCATIAERVKAGIASCRFCHLIDLCNGTRMRPTKEQITDLVFASIDQLNEMLGNNHRLEKTQKTVILKDGCGLDSLGFINLVSLVEEEYLNRFGQSITLSSTDMPSDGSSPFESIGTLVEYIDSLAAS